MSSTAPTSNASDLLAREESRARWLVRGAQILFLVVALFDLNGPFVSAHNERQNQTFGMAQHVFGDGRVVLQRMRRQGGAVDGTCLGLAADDAVLVDGNAGRGVHDFRRLGDGHGGGEKGRGRGKAKRLDEFHDCSPGTDVLIAC